MVITVGPFDAVVVVVLEVVNVVVTAPLSIKAIAVSNGLLFDSQ